MTRLACLAAALALAAMPAAAGAQGSLLGTPQIGAPPVTTAAPTTTASTSSGDLSTFTEVLIFAGGVGLIAIIAVVILADARRRAPVVERVMPEPTPGQRHAPNEKQRRRAKAREARLQRKKNRARGR